MITSNGDWDVNCLHQVLPQDIILKIHAIPPPDDSIGDDIISWNNPSPGAFSIKHAYHVLSNEQPGVPVVPWLDIWNTKSPERWKFHLWKVVQDRLLTNSMRSKWNLGTNSCPICRNAEETTIHAMRDCPIVMNIWVHFLKPSEVYEFFNCDLLYWCRKNICKGWGDQSPKDWKVSFSGILYMLWNWRNSTAHDADFVYPHDAVQQLKKMVQEVYKRAAAEDTHIKLKRRETIFINWKAPPDGYLKLNTDGASKGNPGLAGCGGLFRDSEGRWVNGFCSNIGICNAFNAELWGIYFGLKLAWNQGYRMLHVESDSSSVINLLTSPSSSINENGIVTRIKSLCSKEWTVLFFHTLREGNSCADYLANKGLTMEIGCHTIQSPDSLLRKLIADDYRRTAAPRNIISR